MTSHVISVQTQTVLTTNDSPLLQRIPLCYKGFPSVTKEILIGPTLRYAIKSSRKEKNLHAGGDSHYSLIFRSSWAKMVNI